MKFTVKLFATFRDGREKIQQHDLPDGTTPRDVLNLLKIDPSEVAILLVNGRDGELDKPISENDVISFFPPVGGG